MTLRPTLPLRGGQAWGSCGKQALPCPAHLRPGHYSLSPYPQPHRPPSFSIQSMERGCPHSRPLSPYSSWASPKGGFQLGRFQKEAGGRKRSTGLSEVQATEQRNVNFLASHGTVWRWHLGRTHKLPPTQSSQDWSRTSPAIPLVTCTVVAALPAPPGSGAALRGGARLGRRVWCSPAQVQAVQAGRRRPRLVLGGAQQGRRWRRMGRRRG